MKRISAFLLLLILHNLQNNLNAQEEDYIEFNDRKNTVHGVYLGLGFGYGTIDKAETYTSSFKVAYVANQQFEIGLILAGLYSDINRLGLDNNNRDLASVYGGLHIEPILFSKSKINLSFPLLIGGGGVALIDDDVEDPVIDDNDWKHVFVAEPGVNVLYNINRYIQLEAGVKYRLSSRVSLQPEYSLKRINGFSGGFGIKIGVFNMGRNRYKKNIDDE
ncbi:hypothetical protein [Flavivirga algicola]|uniref:Outer membrane protein beta-barrel domain-containing protein n=1 Tax=Flavivirga algicola TaxID=2729136 RepID=A0ABX1S0Z4_9FLAO|nr:hypothetical protein [Flavivirga algicola]NMH89550.1 hypothetical protein [Flavivirga algicola]